MRWVLAISVALATAGMAGVFWVFNPPGPPPVAKTGSPQAAMLPWDQAPASAPTTGASPRSTKP